MHLSYQRRGGYFNATNEPHIGIEPLMSILDHIGMLAGYETEKTYMSRINAGNSLCHDIVCASGGGYFNGG